MGDGGHGIQVSCGLHQLARPLGGALGVLCQLSDEMREVITPDVDVAMARRFSATHAASRLSLSKA
jgi:aminoglycoside N3'-acetyltransferase